MVQFVFIGIGAGLASALMFLSPLGGTSLALPLFFLSGLPIAIAGLGWGVAAAGTGALLAAVVLGLGVSPPAAGIYLAVFGAPLAWLTRVALLSRDTPAGREWFPLGRILLHAAIAAALGTIAAGVIAGYDPVALAADMTAMLTSFMTRVGEVEPPPSAAELAPFVKLNVSLMPFTVPAVTLTVTVFSLWLASRIVSASGRLSRPRQPMWTAALPLEAVLVLVVAAGIAIAPGAVGYAASAVAGAMGAAAALAGLSVLHAMTLGLNLRVLILVAAYVGTVFLGLPIFLFAILGIVDTFINFRARRPGGAPPPATT